MAFTQEQVNQIAREAAAQAGGTISYSDAINAAINAGIPAHMVLAAGNTGVITGLPSDWRSAVGASAPAPVATPAAAAPVAAAPSTPAYFNANPDVAAAYAQNSYGMTPDDFAKTHYEKYGWLEQRAAPTNVTTPTDAIENLYNTYAQRWSDPEGYAYWSNQFGPTVDANEAAIFRTAVEEARRAGTESPTIYSSLTGQSTPDQIAAAYNQYVNSAGGDTQKAQENAANYLSKLGLSTDTIRSAYDQYLGDYASGVASKVFGTFGSPTASAPELSGILSGFEAIGKGQFTEDQAKRLLGTETFKQYKDLFGQNAKKFTDDILADKSLSGQEAFDFVQNARKYGIDDKKFAEMTGYKPDLYTNIQNAYDTTVNNLVDKSLEGKTDLGDRIKTGLALQSKYGLTDEDIAKAADIGVDELKGYLDPVRNFGEDFKKATSGPDVAGKDILSFLETAKKNQAINSVYGTNLEALEGKINELNQKWGGRDGYQAENIYNQINQITKAVGGKNWTGSWSGSGGDSAMKAAVGVLMDKGVDNLTDLKVEKNYQKMDTTGEFYDGKQVYTEENGRKYVYDSRGEYATLEYLPSNAKTVPGKIVDVGGYDGGVIVEPLTAEELKSYDAKTGKFDSLAGNKLVDASSGKVVARGEGNKFVLHSYETGNFLKSNYKEFGIMMTDQGVPVPYQTSEKGGLVYSPVLPLTASFLLPGASSLLSSGIASATGGTLAAGSLANTALTQGLMSGTLSKVAGGDFGKGFVGGAIGAPIAQGISSLLPTGMDPALAKTATNVGTGVATSALMGRPIDWTSTALNAGVQYGAQQLPWNLTQQQVNLLGGIATPLLQGQSIDPVRLGGILANYAIKSQSPYTKGAK